MVEALLGFVAGLIVMDAAWYWMLMYRTWKQNKQYEREWEWHQRGWND